MMFQQTISLAGQTTKNKKQVSNFINYLPVFVYQHYLVEETLIAPKFSTQKQSRP